MNTKLQLQLIDMLQSSPIARLFGMRLSYDASGHAHLHLPYNPSLDHALHGIHGGAIATLLDNAGWFTSAALRAGQWVSTSELSIHLLEPACECDLEAEGWLVRTGKRSDVAEMKVVGADGVLYAIGTGTFVVADSIRIAKT